MSVMESMGVCHRSRRQTQPLYRDAGRFAAFQLSPDDLGLLSRSCLLMVSSRRSIWDEAGKVSGRKSRSSRSPTALQIDRLVLRSRGSEGAAVMT